MDQSEKVLITSLLKRLWPDHAKENVTAAEIANAVSLIFTNSLSAVQTGALLTALHFTGLDRDATVLALCARAMRSAAAHVTLDARLLPTLGSSKSENGSGKDDGIARVDTVIQAPVVRAQGTYRGGFCDIVGTGGDSHHTFNISTTSSVIASALLRIAKHGNRASTSKSGSADLLMATQFPQPPNLNAITPATLARVYCKTNYAFLFAPVFHPAMRYVAPIRTQLGWRTIFNLLGPLSNPVEQQQQQQAEQEQEQEQSSAGIEARVIGVARKDLGPAFAEALLQGGARKALVVCGDEDLDELSCAGITHCWWLRAQPGATITTGATGAFAASNSGRNGSCRNATIGYSNGGKEYSQNNNTFTAETVSDPSLPPSLPAPLPPTNAVHCPVVEYFTLTPADFGLTNHALSQVKPGREPSENARIFERILAGSLPRDDPLMEFVLMNCAALLVVSGVCDAETDQDAAPAAAAHSGNSNQSGASEIVIRERGPGGGRWKEGVRRAWWCIESGAARREWERFVQVTNELGNELADKLPPKAT